VPLPLTIFSKYISNLIIFIGELPGPCQSRSFIMVAVPSTRLRMIAHSSRAPKSSPVMRFGNANNNWLVYGTGGLAVLGAKTTKRIFEEPPIRFD
jgi:hypothetical protein